MSSLKQIVITVSDETMDGLDIKSTMPLYEAMGVLRTAEKYLWYRFVKPKNIEIQTSLKDQTEE
jgi:hypothetical protein